MAKKKVNKSQEVRDYLAANKDAKPKEVVAAMKKKGVKVTPQQVSTIRYSLKSKRGRVTKTLEHRVGNGYAGKKVSVQSLVATKAFTEKVGGVEEAKGLIAALEKLQG